MKISQIQRHRESGNALLVVMILIGLLIAALSTYLTLTSQENNMVMRSACWNNALPLAEAGVEEAMSHLGRNTNGYAVDGWKANGTNYFKKRPLNNDYYNVSFSGDLNNGVTIVSTGAVQWADGTYISRVVQVSAESRTYPKAMGLVARGITLGGSLSIDSYDTSTNTMCNPTNFGWYDLTRRSAGAFVGNPVGTFNVAGSVVVRGYASSGRGYAIPTFGGSSLCGDLAWSSGAQPGHSTNGFYTAMPDVRAPYSSGPAPASGTVNGTNYNYVLQGNKYFASNLSNGSSLYVTGYSTLYVTGSVALASITFATNSRLDLYVAAPSIDFAPDINGAAPPQFTVWGLPSCTAIKLTGTARFVGVIYAPEALLSAMGGAEYYGAVAAGSFKCVGNFTLHQDLAVGKVDIIEPLTMLSWTEL